MLRGLAAGALAVAVVGAGCMLVTGSTDGYTPPPNPLQCFLPSDCAPQQEVCCLNVQGGTVTSSCQASCPFALQQTCIRGSDCGDGGTCYVQSCTPDGGPTVQVATCGPIPDICAQ
jgi:hypothetical protein